MNQTMLQIFMDYDMHYNTYNLLIEHQNNISQESSHLFLKYIAYLLAFYPKQIQTFKIATDYNDARTNYTTDYRNTIPQNKIIIEHNFKFNLYDIFTIYQTEQYRSINRPLTIKSIENIIKEYKTDKLILQITQGIAIDLHNNVMFVNIPLEVSSRAKVSVDFGLCFYKPFLDLPSELRQSLNEATEIFMPYKQLRKQRLFEESLNNLKETMKKTQKQTYKNNLEQKEYLLESLLNQYTEALNDKFQLTQLLLALDNGEIDKQTESAIGYLNRLFKQNQLARINTTITQTFQIHYKALPIEFFDVEQLKKAIPNLDITETHRKYLNKIVEGTHTWYVGPLTAVIKFATKNNVACLDFTTTTAGATPSGRFNPHPIWNGVKGCRGTFGPYLAQAETESNLVKLIHYITQFYQSISVLDGAGQQAVIKAIIVEKETGNIAYIPSNDIEIQKPININQVLEMASFFRQTDFDNEQDVQMYIIAHEGETL